MTRRAAASHCRVDLEHWSRYLEGEFTSAQCLACDTHLKTCADCREKLGDVRRVVAALKAVGRQPLPPGVRAAARRRARALMLARRRGVSS
jgi:predicted anti-sigma-YlaC factor YlaD